MFFFGVVVRSLALARAWLSRSFIGFGVGNLGRGRDVFVFVLFLGLFFEYYFDFFRVFRFRAGYTYFRFE